MDGYRLHYDELQPPTDEHASQRAAYHASQLGPLLPADRGARVLDVGCATGHALLGLGLLGFDDVTGIDLDAGVVALARQRGLDAHHVGSTAAFLDDHEAWDVILLLDVLEHVAHAEQIDLLRAIRGKLRPSGRLIVTVPNASSLVAYHYLSLDHTHVQAFTVDSLRYALRLAGFAEVTFGSPPGGGGGPGLPAGGPPRSRVRALRALSPADLRRLLVRSAARRVWRWALDAELGAFSDVSAVPLDPNLTVVAR